MTDEQAAIERLRDLLGTRVDTWNAPAQALQDMWILAEAYIAEHPADDAEPVTEDWLRSVGFWTAERYGGDDVLLIDIGKPRSDDSLCWDNKEKRMSLWVASWELLLGAKTRGDVRRLCTALGVPLTIATSR